MAEYITIDQAIEAVTKTQGLRGDALHALYKLPTIDIVHCKECKHNEDGECRKVSLGFDIACYDHWVETRDDFFCADGERKSEE